MKLLHLQKFRPEKGREIHEFSNEALEIACNSRVGALASSVRIIRPALHSDKPGLKHSWCGYEPHESPRYAAHQRMGLDEQRYQPLMAVRQPQRTLHYQQRSRHQV